MPNDDQLERKTPGKVVATGSAPSSSDPEQGQRPLPFGASARSCFTLARPGDSMSSGTCERSVEYQKIGIYSGLRNLR